MKKISHSHTQLNTQIEAIKTIFSEYLDNKPFIRELSISNYEDLQNTFDNHRPLDSQEIISV